MESLDVLLVWLATWGYACRTVTKPPTLLFDACDSDALKAWLHCVGGDHLFGVLLVLVYRSLWDVRNPREAVFSMAFSRDKHCADFTQRRLAAHDYVLVTRASFMELMDSSCRNACQKLMGLTGATLVFCLDDEDGPSAQKRLGDNGNFWITPDMFDAVPTCVANVAASAARGPQSQLLAAAAWIRGPTSLEDTFALKQHFQELHQRLVINPPKGSALNP